MNKDTWITLDMLMTGKVIKNMIKKSGYSIKDIQKKLKLSCPQPIYRWMSGQTLPSLDNLYMLSSILGMHMEDLLMPRKDEMWILHEDIANTEENKRMMIWFRTVNANG